MPLRFGILVGVTVVVVAVGLAGWHAGQPREPSWKGQRLSAWLDAYDSHNRFEEGDSLYSPLSDEEIEEALDEMRPAALPVLLRWLTDKSSRLRCRLNQMLRRQSLIGFRFEDRDYQILAVTGFMAYDAAAQPMLPELLKLTRSADRDTRLVAYEAAFFIRPEKTIFLPLAQRALQEPDPAVQAMAAQWLQQRFPEEAERMLPPPK